MTGNQEQPQQQVSSSTQKGKKKLDKQSRKLLLILVLVICVPLLFACCWSSYISDEEKKGNDTQNKQEQKIENSDNKKTAPEPEKEEKTKEAGKEIENFDIAVSSSIIKKVDGKHRYFFNIRNNDDKDFEGTVDIEVYNDDELLGKESFKTTSSIGAGLGTSVYFDINTGPVSVHGEYGVTKFKYKVLINKDTVKEGDGDIASKYEDLDY